MISAQLSVFEGKLFRNYEAQGWTLHTLPRTEEIRKVHRGRSVCAQLLDQVSRKLG
jgi:hypothetical protein